MAKPKLGLGNLTDDQIIALANTIKTAMTGNVNFTTPNPTLASIGTAITTAQTKVGAYNTAKATAENGARGSRGSHQGAQRVAHAGSGLCGERHRR